MQLILYLIIFLLGSLIGNFATSVFYRLPRGITIAGFNKQHTQPPHCSSCHHLLKWYEYLPIISLFSTLLTCNYCRQPVPRIYCLIETTAAILSVACFYLFGANPDIFIVLFCFSISCLLVMALLVVHRQFYSAITWSIVVEGVLYRTLIDHTLFYWAVSLGSGAVLSLWLLRQDKFQDRHRRHIAHVVISLSSWLPCLLI